MGSTSQALIKKLSEMDEDGLNRLYVRVFGNDDGELLLQDLKNRAYFYTPIVNEGGGNDPMAIGFRDGRRSMVGHIQEMMTRPEPKLEVLEDGISNSIPDA